MDGLGGFVGGGDFADVGFGGVGVDTGEFGDAGVEELFVAIEYGFLEGPAGGALGVGGCECVDECLGGGIADGAGGEGVDPFGGGFGIGLGPGVDECVAGGGFAAVVGHALNPVGGCGGVLLAPEAHAALEGFDAGEALCVGFEPEKGVFGILCGPNGDDFEHASEAVGVAGIVLQPEHGGLGVVGCALSDLLDEGVFGGLGVWGGWLFGVGLGCEDVALAGGF